MFRARWDEAATIPSTVLPPGVVGIAEFVTKAHGPWAENRHPFGSLFHTPDGGVPENWIPVITGPFDIRTFLSDKGRVLQQDVLDAREALIASEAAKAARGERAIREDDRRAILSLTVNARAGMSPELVLGTYKTSYFTIRTLGNLRTKACVDNPASFALYFQNLWGMSTLVEARDQTGRPILILSRRSGEVDLYPGCYNVTASGSMEGGDFDEQGQIDLYRVATRELKEETGIRPGNGDTFETLGLGYNPESSDWNLQMFVRTSQSAEAIRANWGMAPDSWEIEKLLLIDASQLGTVLTALKEREGHWTPNGASSVYIYLCRRFGRDAVLRAWRGMR